MKWNNLSMADRAAYIKLGVENGITDLGVIRSIYNKYDEGGNLSTPVEKVYDADTLPEVVIKPEEWQTDFIKNFANKETRQKIYKYIPRSAARNNNIKKRRILKNLGYSESDITNYIRDTSHENLLKEEEDLDNKLHRLYNVYNKAERPKIVSKDFLSNFTSRPHYNGFLNKVTAGSLSDIIAELAHPIQMKYDKDYSIFNLIRDVPLTLRGELNMKEHYKNPSHYEYRTHSVVEPILKDYIYNNDYRYNTLINGLDTSIGDRDSNVNYDFLQWKNNR